MNPRIVVKTAETKAPKILLPAAREITGLPVYGIKEALESNQDCMVSCSKAELLEFVSSPIVVREWLGDKPTNLYEFLKCRYFDTINGKLYEIRFIFK